MKLRVYRKDENKEEIVRLALREENGTVMLHEVDKDGNPTGYGNILVVRADGVIERCSSCYVPGLQKDGRGRVLITED